MFFTNQDTLDKKAETILKTLILFLFAIYLVLFFKITIFKYSSFYDIFTGRFSGFRSLNLIPFKTVRDFIDIVKKYGAFLWAFSNIIGNILIVVPLGFCLPLLFIKMRDIRWVMLITVLVSLMIESCQYIFSMGSADIDDLIMNTLGGVCGYLAYILLKKIIKQAWILYITTILAAIMVFIVGFTVARVQFGSLLGLVNYTVVVEGNENIPDTPNDINGVLIDWKEDHFTIYEDIMNINSSLTKYAKKRDIAVDESTQFYCFSWKSKGTVTTETYTLISMLEAKELETNSRVTIWMNKSIAGVVVFMEPFFMDNVEIVTSGEGIADYKDIETIPVPDLAKPKDNEGIEISPKPDMRKESDDEGIKDTQTPDVTNEEEHQEEIIEGSIESINEDRIVINLIDSWKNENGWMAVTTGIMLDVTFEEDAMFTVKTIRNMGADYDIRSGSRSDLDEHLTVNIKGYRDGDAFVGYEVEIIIVIY